MGVHQGPNHNTRSSDADFAAYNAAVGGLDATHAIAIQTMIAAMKAAGSWQLRDRVYALANQTTLAARTCLKTLATLTVTGAPTFTADRGYTGTLGAGDWLGTGFNPTLGGQYVRDSNNKAVYVRTACTGVLNNPEISQDSTTIDEITTNGDGVNRGFGNNAAALKTQAHGGVKTGLFHSDRTASNLTTLYRDGSSIDSSASASAALVSNQIALLRYPDFARSSDAQIGFAAMGAALGGTIVLAERNAVIAYLTAVGGL